MKLSIIGTGNAATHLAKLLFAAGHKIEYIQGRSPARARKLAKAVNARVPAKVAELETSDCIILCVKDSALPAVAKKLPATQKLVLHTSGSEPLKVLHRFRNSGVLYPVQTFTASAGTPSRVPFCVEGSNAAALRRARQLAKSISGMVVTADSRQRLIIHTAAVFANNFTNHLYVIAHDLLSREGLPWNMLHPLMEETVRKAELQSPAMVQTGPARRGDRKTQQAHLALLRRNKNAAALYKLLSADIARSTFKK